MCPLPVELILFSATVKNQVVEWRWSTASEQNNDFYTVEKAVNIEQFQVVGERIKGKGPTNVRSNYVTEDPSPSYGRSYYRLKQTDFDGKFSYLDVKVNYDGPALPALEPIRIHPTEHAFQFR